MPNRIQLLLHSTCLMYYGMEKTAQQTADVVRNWECRGSTERVLPL